MTDQARALDLRPSPGAAPLARQVRAQALMETRLLLRNGEQVLLALVIPVIALVAGVAAADYLTLEGPNRVIDVLTPGVLALAVLSTSFASLAIATGFERRYGVLKRLGSSPLPRHGLLLGKVGALLIVEALQIAVIAVAALLLGWEPSGGLVAIVTAGVSIILGTAALASLGLLLAGLLRAEATLAAANLIYLLLLIGGGVVLPISEYGAFGEALAFLPSGALGESLRAALLDARADWTSYAVLIGWAAIGSALTARTFSWE